jgi:molybdate transport system substrate-binding protein
LHGLARFGIVLAVLIGVSPAVAVRAAAADVLVFAAASTTEVVIELDHSFAAAGHGTAAASFGSSGLLARQIERGAPADIIVSANRAWVDYLDKRGRLASGTRRIVAHNSIVLIAPKGRAPILEDNPDIPLPGALGDTPLAIADPDHAPAGAYARQALENLGVWKEVAHRTARMPNVRGALALVERGECALGIVYRSDALASSKVDIAYAIPARSHDPIEYDAAIVAGHDRPVVRAYLDYMLSVAGQAVFRDHGFAAE